MDQRTILVLVAIAVIGGSLIYYVFHGMTKEKFKGNFDLDESEVEKILSGGVRFYQKLNEEERKVFVTRVLYFLKRVRISAEKGAVLTDSDIVLVAAAGTIPLFHFKNWSYENLDEVLVYPGTFNEQFSVEDEDRNVLGMVGSGTMNRKMILSQEALRAGFVKNASGSTAIHEFVHLIDKADGATDGVPEYLIPKELVEPWLKEVHKTIREIRGGHSDIRDYAATNEAEFLAVISEYFFKKPHLLEDHHPELYKLLNSIYNKQSVVL